MMSPSLQGFLIRPFPASLTTRNMCLPAREKRCSRRWRSCTTFLTFGRSSSAGKRTRTLGLITTDLALHAPSQIVSAVKSRAAEQGASVLISMVEQPRQCQAALQTLLAQRVDALLVNVPLDDPLAEELGALASPVPVLFLGMWRPQRG